MTSIIKVDQIQLSDGGTPTVKDLGLEAGSVIQCKVHTQTIGNASSGADIEGQTVTGLGLSNAYDLNTVDITPKYNDSLILMQWSGQLYSQGSSSGGADIFFTKDNANIVTVGGNRNSVGFYYGVSGSSMYSMQSCQYSFTAGQTTLMSLKAEVAAYSSARSVNLQHDGTTTLTVWEIAQ